VISFSPTVLHKHYTGLGDTNGRERLEREEKLVHNCGMKLEEKGLFERAIKILKSIIKNISRWCVLS
jgi:hypothetical protein